MTVQERKTLEDFLRKRLEDELTVRQMNTVTDALRGSCDDMDNMAMAAQGGAPDDLLQAFLQAKRVAGLSEKTLYKYSRTMKRIFAEENVTPANVTVDHLRHWLAKEFERGISEKTLAGDRDSMSSFFGWLWREGLIARNPCGNLDSIKVPKIVRKPFDSVEIEQIKEACGKNLRDKAIVCFLLATGCRVSEVVQLNRNDIDFVAKECTVFGKGAKERTVLLDDVSAAILKKYLESRADTSVALFASRQGDRIQANGIRAMLKRLEKRSGVSNIHPHRFIRTMATSLNQHGMPVEEVAMLLGHEEIKTTMKYVVKDKAMVKHHYQQIVA